MKVTLTGSNGLIGSHLARALKARAWEIVALSRTDLARDPQQIAALIEGSDLVINLAGAPIIGRWSKAYKEILYNSRINTTHKLTAAMLLCSTSPSLFISASAVGIYPSTGGPYAEKDEIVDTSFLGHLAQDWEKEAFRFNERARVAVLRFGIVLASDGGALKKLLPFFRLGLGGPIGNGNQPFAWIHIDDIVNMIFFLLSRPDLKGPFNCVAPELLTNKQFTKKLARSLKRPAILTVPGFGLKLLFGEGGSVLTQGQSVLPEKLLNAGFQFSFPGLDLALAEILNSP